MLKYLVTCGLAPKRRAGRDQRSQRPACSRSTFHSYRPFVEALENRNLLSFLAPVSYAAGSYPRSVAVGDFNGDGVSDLAVANSGSGTVSVLLGKGDGTFQAAQDYAVGSNPVSVVVGDFNGDGHLDLAVANFYDGTVSVLLGNGNGTFQPAQSYGTGDGGYPTSVAVGDFDGDGHLDLALANDYPGSDRVDVLLGNGNGTFQAARSYGVGYALSVAVGDFNGDGHPDLAVAINRQDTVSMLLGKGDGTFQAARSYGVGVYPQSVAVGDFDGDGHLDLVVANTLSGTVSVLLGNGDGTFHDAQNYATGIYPTSVAVGDFNGDGFPDLAVVTGDGVSVLINAADWGGGPGPAPPSRPGLHRPIPSQPQIEPVAALLAVSKPQTQHALSLTFTDLPPNSVHQWPLEMETGQPARPEATFAPTPIVTAWHAQDAVFERWGDPVVDGLAISLLR
jgi:hypothetical protein